MDQVSGTLVVTPAIPPGSSGGVVVPQPLLPSGKTGPLGVIIQSQAIAQTFGKIWWALWLAATRVDQWGR